MLALLFCIFTNYEYINLYEIVICTNWGIFVSFYSAIFFDPDVNIKLANKLNINIYTFHILNFIVHGLVIIYCSNYKNNIKFINSIFAACFHLLWGFYVTKGTFLLNNIYIYMSNNNWYKLWFIAIISEISVYFFYK